MDGLVVIDKPAGLTSQAVVSRCRRALGERKAGHGGTLDPMATGVLLVGLGKATRLLGYLAADRKTYRATIRLGQAMTTDDAEGEPVGESVDATGVDDAALEAAISAYRGPISQVPSSVSAIKVDGKRAYALVRAGQDVELKPRAVTIHRYDVLARRDCAPFVDLDVEVDCSSGTYIRALARDLGNDLGVGGHLTALRRTQVGAFAVADAVPLDEVAPADVIDTSEVARRCFPVVELSQSQATDVGFGRPLQIAVAEDPTAVLSPDGRLLALYRPDPERSGWARPVAVLI